MANLPTRNNNPGDLKDPKTGNFLAFNDPTAGFNALKQDLQDKITGNTSTGLGPNSTLQQLASVWAPASDGNDPVQYANTLAQKLKVAPTAPLASLNVDDLASAIAGNEGYQGSDSSSQSSTSNQMTYQQFAEKIKAKYPQYQSIDDNTLAQKVLAKYPQYQSVVQGGTNTDSGTDSNGFVTKENIPAGTGQAAPAPSFLQSISNDVSNAASGVGNAISQTATGQINPASGLIQGLGSVAGGISSGINDAATHLPVVGGLVSGAEGLLGKAAGAAANTAPGKAVVGAAQNFAQAHPELAGDIGGVANIAGLVGTFYGGGAALSAAQEGVGSAVANGTFGDLLAGAADKSVTNEALDIVAPAETKASLKAAIKGGRGSVGGTAGTVSVAPADSTIAAVNAVKPLVKAGVIGSEKTAVENANAIRDEISKEATSLRSQLANQEIKPIVSADDLNTLKTALGKQMEDNFTLVGNSSLYGQRALDKFFSLLPKSGDITAEDVLDARQGLDRWAKGQRGSKIFDPAAASAQSEGLRIVRQGANNLISEVSPDIAVKESLARQSALYDALDNVASKGIKEIGTTKFGRFATRHPLITGLAKAGAKYAAIGAGLKGGADLIP